MPKTVPNWLPLLLPLLPKRESTFLIASRSTNFRKLLERRELIEKIKVARETQYSLRAEQDAQKAKEMREKADRAEEERRAKKAAALQIKAEKEEKALADKKKAEAMAIKLEELAKKAAPAAGKKKKVKKAEEILHEIEEKKTVNTETFVKDEIEKVYPSLL